MSATIIYSIYYVYDLSVARYYNKTSIYVVKLQSNYNGYLVSPIMGWLKKNSSLCPSQGLIAYISIPNFNKIC